MQDITIVAGADDRYAAGLAVTLRSAITQCSASTFDCYIMDLGLTQPTRQKLSALVERSAGKGKTTNLSWLDINADLSELPERGHLSRAVFARLFLGDLMPDHKRCIYLDSDLLVCGDLIEVWTTPLEDRGLAAVKGRSGATASRLIAELVHPDVWDERTLNSGVLFMDLEYFRNERIGQRAIDMGVGHATTLKYADQDLLNVLFSGRWLELDPSWNVVVKPGRIGHLADAKILHFVGPRKPWTRRYRPADQEVQDAHDLYIKCLNECGLLSAFERFWLARTRKRFRP